jgi:hypothetical protein
MEIRRLQILWNVKIWWISMLEPLKRIMEKYKKLIVKMSQDSVSIAQARFKSRPPLWYSHVVGFILFATIVRSSACLNQICTKDIFICDFVAAVKICQADLYMMYSNPSSNYQHEHFQVFSNVVENSFAIFTSTMVWKHLLFIWLVIVM